MLNGLTLPTQTVPRTGGTLGHRKEGPDFGSDIG